MDKIKTILLTAFALVVAMSVASCGDDDNPTVAPSATGTFEDTDGTLYHWVRVGSLDWMVENYRGGEAWYNQSYVANGFESHFDVDDEDAENALIAQQGNYLTWQQAKDCAPEGWRLPTDDDFKNLEAALGMKAGDIDKEGWRSGDGHARHHQEQRVRHHTRGGGWRQHGAACGMRHRPQVDEREICA